ncbi:hypothetical protein EVAR_48637_1 [Eumeta japonica]|uniref:Uncharacterized protein n=1 Tax=Eumeta variegata TaxID=151549 RepID=A0A4C1XPS8_EUMVA|nr:hypothetical protein EVAR_48637_1 [Eumeta japonica]
MPYSLDFYNSFTESDTRGCRRRVTCPMGDFLRHRLGIGVRGWKRQMGRHVYSVAKGKNVVGEVVGNQLLSEEAHWDEIPRCRSIAWMLPS